MQKVNYQLILDETIKKLKLNNEKPSLLLHSCCAPCSSYVLEYLSNIFDVTLFYYDPNISPRREYEFRVEEVKRLLSEMDLDKKVKFVEGRYDPDEFYAVAKGLEELPEGGERCFNCYRLRLSETGKFAEENGFDYFTTTLSISPYKNAEKLNAIGSEIADELGIRYLFSDFKKRNGYKRSIELSGQYGLYRQNYCGCIYSYNDMLKRNKEKEQ